MSKPLLAWHGDPDLKAEVLAKLKEHRAQDEFIQGNYLELVHTETTEGIDTFSYKGCAIGCTLAIKDIGAARAGDHRAMERHYGIPAGIACAIDALFEIQDTFTAAGDFAVAVVENIAPGADLSAAWGQIEEGDDYCTCGTCLFGNGSDVSGITAEFLEALATAPVPEVES